MREDCPEFRELICGHDGVVRKWLRLGARGWRLDVADELSDEFLRDIKSAALAEREDAVVIGEVWEDATNKYAYGTLRRYFQGGELDGTMKSVSPPPRTRCSTAPSTVIISNVSACI